jgi:hypothetical protein
MALDPEQLSDFQVAKNMIRRLVNEKGYSLEDAVEIVTRDLGQTVVAAIRSNVLADKAPAMNAEADRTVQERLREQARQREGANANPAVRVATNTLSQARAPRGVNDVPSDLPSLISFYFESEPNPAKAARMANIEMGKRMAAQAYAEEFANVQKLKADRDAESQDSFFTTTPVGRAVKSFLSPKQQYLGAFGGAKPNPDPNHDIKLEALQRAKQRVAAFGPFVYGSPLQEQSPEDYASELLRNRTMRDTLLSMGEVRDPLDNRRGLTRFRLPDPAMPLQKAPPAPAPEDGVPGWGRKVEGPSASTNEMDSSDLSVTPPVAPEAAPSLVDRVHPNDMAGGNAPAYAPIGSNFSLPIFARPNKGASPVAADVQDRTVNPGILELAKTSLAPYSMQFKDDDLMRFSEDKPRPASPRREEKPSAAPQQGGGFFSNAFKDPYAGMTSQQLWSEYNKTGDPGMFVRADKAMMAERGSSKKSDESEESGKAKGGAVAGKDAAIHKALEIIHHMLTRGR